MKQELMIALLAVLGAVLVTGLIAVPLNEEATIIPNALASHSVDPNACYNDGQAAGEDDEFSQELYEFCEEYGDEYYDGFIDGCP
jgi:hypothetical protein